MEKKGTFASPATALASRVLPVPGGPTSSAPLGILAPICRIFAGIVQEVYDLLPGLFGLVLTGHVGKLHAAVRFYIDLGIALAKGHEVAAHAVLAHPTVTSSTQPPEQ